MNALPVLPGTVPALIVVGALVGLLVFNTGFTETEALVAMCESPSHVGNSIRMVVAFLWSKREKIKEGLYTSRSYLN